MNDKPLTQADALSRATRDAAEGHDNLPQPEGFREQPEADREISDAEQRAMDWEEREMYYRGETEL